MAAVREQQTPNVALVELRENAGLSQHDLAEELNDLARRKFGRPVDLTKKTVGRWERGEVAWPQPFYRRLLAEHFSVAADELGFLRPRPASAQLHTRSGLTDTDELLKLMDAPAAPDPRVEQDQQRWRDVRQAFGTRCRALAVAAESLYPEYRLPGCENTGVIAHPSWIPATPIPLEHIVLDLIDDAPRLITGAEPESASVRPLRSGEHRSKRYSHAIRDLARPTLFENRLTFRLLNVDWSQPDRQLSFGTMGFFDGLDINETLAHETAQETFVRGPSGGELEVGRPSWRRLSFRKLIGDPFDLARRPMMGAIGTLTIRGGDSPGIVLHARDGLQVAGGGSMIHLLPAGIFQPSSVHPESVANDFSVWRNIQREYAEEVLGHDEYDGTGEPVDYDLPPFAGMDAALTDGRLHAYCLGVTLDALTLAGDILTVVVLKPDLHDELFADTVDHNTEGEIPARRIPFERNTIDQLLAAKRLSPGAVAALHLAWQHRHFLLDFQEPSRRANGATKD